MRYLIPLLLVASSWAGAADAKAMKQAEDLHQQGSNLELLLNDSWDNWQKNKAYKNPLLTPEAMYVFLKLQLGFAELERKALEIEASLDHGDPARPTAHKLRLEIQEREMGIWSELAELVVKVLANEDLKLGQKTRSLMNDLITLSDAQANRLKAAKADAEWDEPPAARPRRGADAPAPPRH
jgi:hypothetical protein